MDFVPVELEAAGARALGARDDLHQVLLPAPFSPMIA